MASWYVWSGATGGGTGVDWANAYVTLQAAMTAKAAGDTFFVAHDHAQTAAAAVTITAKGTVTAPNYVYCVNRAGSVPPVAADMTTGATITATGTPATATIGLVGHVYECNGIAFTCAGNMFICTTALGVWRLVNCKLRISGTTATSRIFLPDIQNNVGVMENTTVQFGAVGQGLGLSGNGSVWRNTPNALVGPTYPTNLFKTNNFGSTFFVEGVDLSAFPSGNTLCETGASNVTLTRVILKDCKLSASPIQAANTSYLDGPEAVVIRCDSGDTNYRNERYCSQGAVTTETTVVYTGGATDGTTGISWKFVTSTIARWEFPLHGFPITIWNETVGSPITVTFQGIWGTGSVPNNDDIYFDCQYLGTSGFPLGTEATSTKASALSANAPLSAGSGSWGGSTTKFQMSTTFTPQEKGPLTILIKAAKASSTFYVDPEPIIT